MKAQKSHIQTFKKSPHHHTPGSHKKPVVNQECKAYLKMKRFTKHIGSNDSKDAFLVRLEDAMSAGVVVNKDLIVGFNGVMKCLEKYSVSAVVIAKDANSAIINSLIEVCELNSIPFVILPSIADSVKKMCRIKSFTCCAIRKEIAHDSAEESLVAASRQAKLDEILEFVRLSTSRA